MDAREGGHGFADLRWRKFWDVLYATVSGDSKIFPRLSARASDNPKSFSVQNESTISINTSASVFFTGGLYLHRHKSTCGGNGKNFPCDIGGHHGNNWGGFFRDEWSNDDDWRQLCFVPQIPRIGGRDLNPSETSHLLHGWQQKHGAIVIA